MEFNIKKVILSNFLIDSAAKNFIDWSNVFSIVGHVTIRKNAQNQTLLVDITDYVDKVLNLGNSSSIRLLLYRPFRHVSFQTTVGIIPEDDLSNGSIANFYSVIRLFLFNIGMKIIMLKY